MPLDGNDPGAVGDLNADGAGPAKVRHTVRMPR